jgi:hypothetical protein
MPRMAALSGLAALEFRVEAVGDAVVEVEVFDLVNQVPG